MPVFKVIVVLENTICAAVFTDDGISEIVHHMNTPCQDER
jgi:hypothetical protein